MLYNPLLFISFFYFFFNDTATTEIYTLSLHDALPISRIVHMLQVCTIPRRPARSVNRSEEHTSELQSHHDLVCRLLLEKKKITKNATSYHQKTTTPASPSTAPDQE